MSSDSVHNAPSVETAPVCAECGYNLTGLPLPRPCPECGRMAEPEAERQAVVDWYRFWRGFFLRKPPPAFGRALGDPRCRAATRRRIFFGLFLPWFLTLLIFYGIRLVEIRYEMEGWYESPQKPGQKLAARLSMRNHQFLEWDFNFFSPQYGPPLPDAKWRERRLSTSLSLNGTRFRLFAVFIAGLLSAPWLGIGYAWLVARWTTRRKRNEDAPAAARPPASAIAAFVAPWFSFGFGLAALWAVLRTAAVILALVGTQSADWLLPLVPAGLFVYLFLGVAALLRGLRGCRPRRQKPALWVEILVGIGWFGVHIGGWALFLTVFDRIERLL